MSSGLLIVISPVIVALVATKEPVFVTLKGAEALTVPPIAKPPSLESLNQSLLVAGSPSLKTIEPAVIEPKSE